MPIGHRFRFCFGAVSQARLTETFTAVNQATPARLRAIPLGTRGMMERGRIPQH